MKKLPFSTDEKKILQGHFKKVAKKHGVTPVYVSYLCNGKRPIKSKRSAAIIKDLHRILEVLNTLYQ